MQCSLYSSDGPLMSQGTCDHAEDAITMVAREWHMTPQKDGPPLALVLEGGHRYQVMVAEVHVTESHADTGPTEVYRLVPLGSDEEKERGGFLAGLKSLFGHKGT